MDNLCESMLMQIAQNVNADQYTVVAIDGSVPDEYCVISQGMERMGLHNFIFVGTVDPNIIASYIGDLCVATINNQSMIDMFKENEVSVVDMADSVPVVLQHIDLGHPSVWDLVRKIDRHTSLGNGRWISITIPDGDGNYPYQKGYDTTLKQPLFKAPH